MVETAPPPTPPLKGRGDERVTPPGCGREEIVWRAALALVGVRFRLHGRVPETGLDCVGLVAAAYSAAGVRVGCVPDDYRMRDVALEQLEGWLQAAGLAAVDDCAVGDVVVSDMGRGQFHLMIAGDGACVHAHAGLRRVVLMPGVVGSVVGRWRASTGSA